MMLQTTPLQPRCALLLPGSSKHTCRTQLCQRVRPARIAARRSGVQAVAEPMQQQNSGAPSAPTNAPQGEWGPTSWRNYKAMQQPVYPDQVWLVVEKAYMPHPTHMMFVGLVDDDHGGQQLVVVHWADA